MKSTLGAISLVGLVLAMPLAGAIVAVASDESLATETIAAPEDGYEYDYPTSLWADH